MCIFFKPSRVRKDYGKHQPQEDTAVIALLLNFSILLTVESKYVPVDERENQLNPFPLFQVGPIASRHSQSNFKL